MKRYAWPHLCLLVALFWSLPGICQGAPGRVEPTARTPIPADATGQGVWHGGAPGAAKAAVDTLHLLGGPARDDGKFQNPSGLPDEEGWTSVDRTQAPAYWHVDTFNAENLDPARTPNHAMWCGTADEGWAGGTSPGYGNGWDQWLDWSGAVADNAVATTVTVKARLNHDLEPIYDYVALERDTPLGMEEVARWLGAGRGEVVDVSFLVDPADYMGVARDQVHLRWRGVSDREWSDQDGLYPSDGMCQLDDVEVLFGGERQTFDDFEPGSQVSWSPLTPPRVGDFAKVWPRLNEIDPCTSNTTPLFAFIDDGLVVPGTGGTMCVTWCYGPGGYATNCSGGLAGPGYQMHIEIWSPALAWPGDAYGGCVLAFDAYRHEELHAEGGVLYEWHVRSSRDGGASWTSWRDRGLGYFGPPSFVRHVEDVTDLVVAGATHVQVSLGAIEAGSYWSEAACDPTPAPYFDNVAVAAYTMNGPWIAARAVDLFQDGFPASGLVDYEDLAGNSVRLDMAANISTLARTNVPGDSIVVDICTKLEGGALPEPPRLHLLLRANPLFDPYRDLPPGLTQDGGLIAGSVPGRLTLTADGDTVAARWNWDLPDSGFFFPGDILHYFIRAVDGGGVSLLPADTSGFCQFPGAPDYLVPVYPACTTVRALPSVRSSVPGDQPHILFWNDSGEGEAWHSALRSFWYFERQDYDVYTTQGPAAGVGNGLGGRATPAQLRDYGTLLYSSGDHAAITLSDGVVDPGDDIGLLTAWLQGGGKNLFCTGDDLAADLWAAGSADFAAQWLGIDFRSGDLRPLIGGQTSPLVKTAAGSGVLPEVSYIAYGGCPLCNDFDAVVSTGPGTRIAEFTNPMGQTGVYAYAAAVWSVIPEYDCQTVFLPYDLRFVYPPPPGPGYDAGRLLRDVLVSLAPTDSLPGQMAKLQGPGAIIVPSCEETPLISGRLWVQKVTYQPGAAAGWVGEVGYGPDGTDPLADAAAWSWAAAAYQGDVEGWDEYGAVLQGGVAGEYDTAFRFRYLDGEWIYADLDGTLNGYAPDQAGSLTVTPAPDDPDGVLGGLRIGPNPSNRGGPCTTFSYTLPMGGRVTLVVYDLRGARVTTLIDADQLAGLQRREWDGANDQGAPVPSGVYFARLKTPSGTKTAKLTLAR